MKRFVLLFVVVLSAACQEELYIDEQCSGYQQEMIQLAIAKMNEVIISCDGRERQIIDIVGETDYDYDSFGTEEAWKDDKDVFLCFPEEFNRRTTSWLSTTVGEAAIGSGDLGVLRSVPDNEFLSFAMHELAHHIGMEHSDAEKGDNSIMAPYNVDRFEYSESDREVICNLL